MIPALDISQWQGAWQDRGDEIVLIKMGGGDAGLYMDSRSNEDYTGAVADGRAVGGYWFIGWENNASAEASFFLRTMAPLAENDVYALDIEKGTNPIPGNCVQYVLDMCNYIHGQIGVWPLVYMSLSTLNSYDWTPVLNNAGLWLADWAVSPSDNIPTSHTYVMQQYSDGPSYDHDEWFGTVDQFKAYGWHAQVVAPAPQPVVVPEPVPTPVFVPLPGLINNVPTPPAITAVPTVSTVITGSTSPLPTPTQLSFLQRIIAFIKRLLHIK